MCHPVLLQYGGSFKVAREQYGLGQLMTYYFSCLLTWQISLTAQ